MSETINSQDSTPRWRRLPEERPRQILSAALEVFGEHGLAASRLDDIAKRAGLSKGTIYLYFPNKEELFREMVRNTVVVQIEAAEDLLNTSTRTATETLAEFMKGYWGFIRSPQLAPIFRLVLAEIRNFPDLARFYADEVVARSHRVIGAAIERGIETGEFRPIDVNVAVRMLTAPFAMHGFWCSHRECFPVVASKSDEQVLDEMMQFYFHAIRADTASDTRAAGDVTT